MNCKDTPECSKLEAVNELLETVRIEVTFRDAHAIAPVANNIENFDPQSRMNSGRGAEFKSVEKESKRTRLIRMQAMIAQSLEQRRESVEILQPRDILALNCLTFLPRHGRFLPS